MIEILPYQARWAEEFDSAAARIRELAGPAALRIDHIGSTSVPGLGAKDVLDLQITVPDLEKAGGLLEPLWAAGFRQGAEFKQDLFHGRPDDDPELRKLYLREPEGERRTHIHVRQAGRFNQRYALLFRDYLRASERARCEYELFKRRAADVFPDDIDGYLLLKDPVFHLIYEAASLWAEAVGWSPPE